MKILRRGNKINSFNETSSFDFIDKLFTNIKNEVESKGKSYILGVDEEEYKAYLIDKYNIELLTVDINSEYFGEPIVSQEWTEDRFSQRKYQVEVLTFTISYNFSGSSILFCVRPSHRQVTSTDIFVDDDKNVVSFSFKLYKKDPEEFKRTKAEYIKRAFVNLENCNKDALEWIHKLPIEISNIVKKEKTKYLEQNDFFAAIKVQVNKDTSSVFTAPTIKKKVIPQPSIPPLKEFASEPTMAKETYDDILKVIYDFGKSMERKPSTYQNKDEEGIRDQFLLILETRYDATTATGETFNRGGKTDIILKHAKDGSNLFVAECKFWHGSAEFHKAISQLFDRYLTWRDSKVALLLFVNNKDFSNVIDSIQKEVSNHPYFIKSVGNRGETSFSYNFHLPNDATKVVLFEIIAFHYDK